MLDYLARPQGSALMALAAGSIVVALAAAALLVRQMPGRPSDRQVARFIEERAARAGHSELNDSLVSAIDAAERPSDDSTRAFVPLVVGDAVARLQALPPAEILPRSGDAAGRAPDCWGRRRAPRCVDRKRSFFRIAPPAPLGSGSSRGRSGLTCFRECSRCGRHVPANPRLGERPARFPHRSFAGAFAGRR